MRWILLLLALFGFSLTFSAKSPGLMGIGLLIGFVSLLAALFAFAAARIAATAQSDVVLLTDKDISAMRARQRNKSPSNLPPSNSV